MAGPSTLTRRASEFLGVALFAAAVLWIVALVTYEPSDPAWFFTPEPRTRPRISPAWWERSSRRRRSRWSATPHT